MGERILAAREAQNTNQIAGIIDRDFVDGWVAPDNLPLQWSIPGGITLGWRWHRKEIENYLIDPAVVEGTLGGESFSLDAYRGVLESAANTIAVYEAARTALSLVRPRFEPLPNNWGPQHALDRHPFPPDISDEACRHAMEDTLEAHAAQQIATRSRDRVVRKASSRFSNERGTTP